MKAEETLQKIWSVFNEGLENECMLSTSQQIMIEDIIESYHQSRVKEQLLKIKY